MPTTLIITELQLRLARSVRPCETPALRGFFGHTFSEETLLHHHNPDGSLRYDYPKVQFKVLDSTAYLIGIQEGGEIVERVWRETDVTTIGNEDLPVLESTLRRRRANLGEVEHPIEYRFLSPWLGLNQQNHQTYLAASENSIREDILARVLVGNCLSFAKSLGHRVDARLQANPQKMHSFDTKLKGTPMLGFRGTFKINFEIPRLLGLGKSVSRGFGIVEPLSHPQEESASC